MSNTTDSTDRPASPTLGELEEKLRMMNNELHQLRHGERAEELGDREGVIERLEDAKEGTFSDLYVVEGVMNTFNNTMISAEIHRAHRYNTTLGTGTPQMVWLLADDSDLDELHESEIRVCECDYCMGGGQ